MYKTSFDRIIHLDLQCEIKCFSAPVFSKFLGTKSGNNFAQAMVEILSLEVARANVSLKLIEFL